MRRLRGEHWFWLLLALSAVATLDKSATWADVLTPKGVGELAAVAVAVLRSAMVSAHAGEDGLGRVPPPQGDGE